MVTPEPEWSEYNRSRALALEVAESRTCQNCKAVDSLVEDKQEVRDVTWPDGSAYRVRSFVCHACGARDAVRRDWQAKHENDEPVQGQISAQDGRVLAVQRM